MAAWLPIIGLVFGIFSLGLVPYMMFQLMLRVFYAMHDSKTPMYIGVAVMAVNVAASLFSLAALPAGHVVEGVAAAFGLANLAGTVIAWRILSRRMRGLYGRLITISLVRMHLAAIPGANHVLVDGPRVIAGGKGALVALDRMAGTQLWKVALRKENYPTQPVIMNGLVLVAEDRGALLGVDAQTGEPRGAFDPGSGFSQPALVLPGVAYIISNGGALYSLGLLP